MEGLNEDPGKCLMGNEAHLGWIYNSSTMECSPPEVSKDYKFEEFQSYKWIFFNKSDIEKIPPVKFPLIFGNASWFKDYQDSSAQEIIRVQMVKIYEKRACEDIDNECNELVVTSLFYKAYINVLLFYDVSVPESLKNDMKFVLDSIIDEKEVGLPKSISNGLKESHLYDGITTNVSKNTVWILNEACRHLKCKIIEKPLKPLTVAVSSGNVVDKLLTNDICVVKYKCCEYQSDNINNNKTNTLYDKTEHNVPSYAQITSNITVGSAMVVQNPFNSNSRNYDSLVKDIPVEIHSPTKKCNLIEEISKQEKIIERNQTKVLDLQTQITSEKGRTGDSQRNHLNGSYSSSIRISRGQTTQPDATKKSEYATTDSRYNLRDRSTSCRKRNSSCRRENQELSANTKGNISQGRKAYQEENGNIVTFEKSESQAMSHITGKEINKTSLTSVENISLPKIPISLLSENSNLNLHISKDDNCKNIGDKITGNDQDSNILVAKHDNINDPCSDEYHIVSNHHKLQQNKVVTVYKANNVNSEIDPKDAVHGIDIPTISPYQNYMSLTSTCETETKATGRQDTPNISDLSQTTKCGFASFDHFKGSLKSQNNFKKLEPSKILIDPCGMRRHYYGNVSSNIEEKMILLLGASGSGKTALVNFVANYFEGVKTPDDQTVIVAPTSDKTKEITAYTFCNEKGTDTAVTIIDTPGLNDSSGSEIRDHVNSLKTFLANTASHGLKIHALGFVAQAHLGRLTSSERLVMDYVSTLFGEGVKDNIITLISFADVQESPPVVEAMKNYGIKTKHFFKFNNAVLNDSSVEVDEIDRVYWRTGYKSWKKVMKLLNELMPLSINAMKTLQNEVYTKSFVESSFKDLNCGLIEFFSIYEQGNHKDIRFASNNVWDLVTIAHHHLKYTPEESASLENLLVTSVEKHCVSQLSIPPVYLRTLSFYSPRGLDKCAQAIIASIHPVYLSIRNGRLAKGKRSNVLNKKKKSDKKVLQVNINEQKLMYCHHCEDDHVIERVEVDGLFDSFKKTIGYKKDAIITFKCTECPCEGNIHGAKPVLNSGETPIFFESDETTILHHTNDMLLKVVKMFSLLKSNMTVKDLLKFLLKDGNSEVNTFINALLEVPQ